MHALIDPLVEFLVEIINQVGYFGIFLGMFLESTLVPIPSELVMIPAGMAASKGSMNIYIVTIVGILGNVSGAVFSYHLASSIGRKLLLKVGKYFFVKEQTIIKIEKFFEKHGPISVFIGRLLPGFRHFISLPAGIAKMDLKTFYFYTSAGSTIWTSILAALGFFIGENQELLTKNLHNIILFCVICSAVILALYFIKKRKVN
jgi:membrane protein DedA with SNARE-associated domain